MIVNFFVLWAKLSLEPVNGRQFKGIIWGKHGRETKGVEAK